MLLLVSTAVLATLFASHEGGAQSKTGDASLSIEVGLVMRSGDVKKVPRTEFFLVRQSVAEILAENARRRGKKVMSEQTSLVVLAFSIRLAAMDDKLIPELVEDMAAIRNASVRTATTDFNGKATFSNVPKGEYHLFGIYSFGESQDVAWNVPVTLGSGPHSLILDQSNGFH